MCSYVCSPFYHCRSFLPWSERQEQWAPAEALFVEQFLVRGLHYSPRVVFGAAFPEVTETKKKERITGSVIQTKSHLGRAV